jgi:hypothetical protein
MHSRIALVVVFLAGFTTGSLGLFVFSQEANMKSASTGIPPQDAIAAAQTPQEVPMERPEQG